MNRRGNPISALFSGILCLSVALYSPPLRADEVDDVCAKVLDAPAPSPSNAASNTTNTQKLQYCQAAKSSQDGSDANSAMWKVWAAVGTICTYGCIASFAGGPTSEFLCIGATVGGGVTDAVVTKNFAGVLTSIAGAGAGFAANMAINKSSSEPVKEGAKEAGKDAGKESAKKDKDVGACLNAAMAGVQVFMKFKAMQSADDSVKSNLDSARKLADTTAPYVDPNSAAYQAQLAAAAATASGASGGSTGLNGGVNADGGTPTTSNNVCAQAKNNPSPTLVTSCATLNDRNLPGFVSNPKFGKEFQKDSGLGLGDFYGRNDKPGNLMAQAGSNGLNSAQSSKLTAGLAAVEQAVGPSIDDVSSYAGGGGGGGAAGSEDPLAGMGDMIASLTDSLTPKKPGADDKKTGVSAIVFANQTRSPAAITEDKTLNIFDRVTYRYYFVGRRIISGEIGK